MRSSGATGASLVVKVGGSAGVDLEEVCDDVAQRWRAGERSVLVHGGSDLTNRVSQALGRPPRFVTSPSGHTSRYTDEAAMEVFLMTCCGALNKGIVERLQCRGVPALGLSGLDGRLLEGSHKRSVRSIENGKVRVLRGDRTGRVERVDAALLELLLSAGYLPIISPLAASYEGRAMNVDGDRAAAAVAAALRAEKLVILSNVPGLLADVDDEGSLIPSVTLSEAEAMMASVVSGGMKKKLLGTLEALRGGVGQVVFGDARRANPLSSALAGRGTVIHHQG